MVYVTQSAGRLMRALFEITLKRKWAPLAVRNRTIYFFFFLTFFVIDDIEKNIFFTERVLFFHVEFHRINLNIFFTLN
tara:strand:- start:76 stop:309 length:234 start_codon:yes stop_codon:yes gene_type:complete